jgi:hypothetical protein
VKERLGQIGCPVTGRQIAMLDGWSAWLSAGRTRPRGIEFLSLLPLNGLIKFGSSELAQLVP